MEFYSDYRSLFAESSFGGEKSLEDAFFEYEVKVNKLCFNEQSQYGK